MTLLDFLELHLFKDEYAEAEYQEAKHLGLLNSWADKVNKLAGTKSFYSYAIFRQVSGKITEDMVLNVPSNQWLLFVIYVKLWF